MQVMHRSWLTNVLWRSFAVLAGVALVLPVPAHAQSGELIKDDLSRSAKRILASCDYAEYIAKASELAQALGEAEGFKSTLQSLTSGGIPTMDLITAAATVATKSATEKQVKVEREGLILQLEQACQTWAMARDTQRQLELTQQMLIGTKEQIGYIKDNMGLLLHEKWDDMVQKSRLEVRVSSAIKKTAWVPERDAALGDAIDSSVVGALRMSRLVGESTDTVGARLKELEMEMSVWTTRDTIIDGRRHALCPPESGLPPVYLPNSTEVAKTIFDPSTGSWVPNTNKMDEVAFDAERGWRCGPASPARMQQIAAAAEILRLQMETGSQQTKASAVSVMGADVMQRTINERRRVEALIQNMNMIMF